MGWGKGEMNEMISDTIELKISDFHQYLPKNIIEILPKRDCVHQLIALLPETWRVEDLARPYTEENKSLPLRLWELVGLELMQSQRFYDSIAVFQLLYETLLNAQTILNYRVHKGMPLLWISECFYYLNFHNHTKQYLMLTLIEDSLTFPGKIDPEGTGSYFRLVWRLGLPGSDFERYDNNFKEINKIHPLESRFPEWVLQQVDQHWVTEIPHLQESFRYYISKNYAHYLVNQIGISSGKSLERLACYLLSCVPGFRPSRNKNSRTTEYDIVCAVEGQFADFRSELGRYFVCECKDLTDPADFSIIAKFCRVIDSTKCKFGILFSTKGVTGKNKGTFAEREQMKIYQDRGIVIIVIDLQDIRSIIDGTNFVTLLREKYERVRLDYLPPNKLMIK
jgi:hypothetical protein